MLLDVLYIILDAMHLLCFVIYCTVLIATQYKVTNVACQYVHGIRSFPNSNKHAFQDKGVHHVHSVLQKTVRFLS